MPSYLQILFSQKNRFNKIFVPFPVLVSLVTLVDKKPHGFHTDC